MIHYERLVLLSLCDFHIVCSSVEEGELHASLAGSHVASAMNNPIILDSNCLIAKNYLRNEVNPLVDLN